MGREGGRDVVREGRREERGKVSNLRGLRMSHSPTPSLELAVAMSLGSTGLNITLWKADG